MRLSTVKRGFIAGFNPFALAPKRKTQKKPDAQNINIDISLLEIEPKMLMRSSFEKALSCVKK